jgi:hypothetical protein
VATTVSESATIKLGEPVDHPSLTGEPRGGVDQTEDPDPGDNTIEVADLSLEVAEHGKRRRSSRLIAGLRSEFGPDLPATSQRCRIDQCLVLRNVAPGFPGLLLTD